MKGLIVPHLAEKCQIKIVAELAACVSSLASKTGLKLSAA